MQPKLDIDIFLNDAYKRVKEIYGDSLEKMILYGSYARGDYRDGSDIDIMLLVNCGDNLISERRESMISVMGDLCLDYEIYPSIKVNNTDYFDRWKDSMPLFKNIVKDGVIYA